MVHYQDSIQACLHVNRPPRKYVKPLHRFKVGIVVYKNLRQHDDRDIKPERPYFYVNLGPQCLHHHIRLPDPDASQCGLRGRGAAAVK